MPRSAVTIAPDHTSDATWRAMLSAIKTGIEAMGWVQTSDTGQIDFATVLKPTSGSQVRGYALWQAADTLAGSYPMILRIQFGSAGSATQTRFLISWGYATDGAGTFSGVTNSWSSITYDAPSSTTTAYNCYFSGDTNRLVFLLFDNYTGSADNNLCIGMERSHDNTDAGFFAFAASGGGNNQNHRFIPYTGAMHAAKNNFDGINPSFATLIGTNVGTFPIFPLYVIGLNPSTQLMTYRQDDVSAGSTPTVSMYGASHTFFMTRAVKGAYNANFLAIRWDT